MQTKLDDATMLSLKLVGFITALYIACWCVSNGGAWIGMSIGELI